MRPERAIAACLSALAAGLVALLLLGPTEGAEASEDVPEAATAAPEPQTTAEIETEPVTTEPEQPPSTVSGDSPFTNPVTMTLDYQSEFDEQTRELPAKVPKLHLEARASSERGQGGDVHGIQCMLDRGPTYTFLVDLWNETYVLERRTGDVWEDLEHGEAPSLVGSPRPNVLSMTCDSGAQGTMLSPRVNGEPVTAFLDRESSGRFGAVGVTAWSPQGGHEVIFDGVVVETDR